MKKVNILKYSEFNWLWRQKFFPPNFQHILMNAISVNGSLCKNIIFPKAFFYSVCLRDKHTFMYVGENNESKLFPSVLFALSHFCRYSLSLSLSFPVPLPWGLCICKVFAAQHYKMLPRMHIKEKRNGGNENFFLFFFSLTHYHRQHHVFFLFLLACYMLEVLGFNVELFLFIR